MRRRHKDLQPWVDYFRMLSSYEEKGYLELAAEKHEAYVTEPALYTLAGCDGREDAWRQSRVAQAVGTVTRRMRAWAAFRSHDAGYLSRSFALHAVKAEAPHDLVYTVVLSSRRAWWKLWLGTSDRFEVITY